jgi:hypothetical protein
MDQLLEKLRKAYSHIDYYQFLEKTGFVDSQYALDKFKTFNQAVKLLCQFESDTLERIIE